METFSEVNSGGNMQKKYAVLVKNVCKAYGSSEKILNNISMHVEEGIVYGLLGHSGCGKTSLLNCISGLKKWDSGDIVVLGNKVQNEKGIIARSIGYMPQDVALYEHLTITEMLKYYAKLYHMSEETFQQQISVLEDLLNLPGYGSRRITSLSGGQKRRVSLALTLLHNPDILILDEPTVGLCPLLRKNIWQYLYNLTYQSKTTIIITTHYIEEVKNSNIVGVMRKGTLLAEECPVSLMRTYQTNLLEEAVLEICRKDRNNRRKSIEAQKNILGTVNDLQSVQVSKDNKLLRLFTKHKTGVDDCHENKQVELSCASAENTNDNSKTDEYERTWTGSIRRTLAYAHVVGINFTRHPMFIFIVLFLPPFQMISTCLVMGVEPKYTPLGVVNHEILNWETTCYDRTLVNSKGNGTCDLSKLSCNLIQQFTKGDLIELAEFTSKEDARSAVQLGHINGFIEIPENYSAYIVERAVTKIFSEIATIDGTVVKLHMDMSETVTMFFVLTELFRSFDRFVKELSAACSFDLKEIEIPFFYREPVYGQLDGSARDYIIPALIAGLIFEVSFAVTPLIFINDVKIGTLERSRLAGLKFTELMMGLFMATAVLSVIQSAICYLLLEFGFGFHILGSIPSYVFICLVAAFCGASLGLIFGVLMPDEFMLVISAIFILPFLMIYSGFFRPFEIIPHPFRSLIFYGFPGVAIMRPFRFIVNRGVPLTHPMVWPGILVTIGWSVLFCILCQIVIRKNKH